MKLVDTNLLLYAYRSDMEQHQAAKAWLEGALWAPEPLCLSCTVIVGFIRISSNPRTFENPHPIGECNQIVSSWLELDSVWVLNPGPRHWEILDDLLVDSQCRGDIVMDAHLAALAIEHGATVYSTDRDFLRFDGLRLVNPLA